jgi:putative ABC transport system permease protein
LPKFNFTLFCSLAAIALILAVAGIYSVLSYNIAQRTREFGVRLALGAERGSIVRLVLETGGRLFGMGLIAGLGGSLALSRILSSQTQIFRVDLSDLSALGVAFAALAFLGLAAMAACYLPARRATRIDPLIALRAE